MSLMSVEFLLAFQTLFEGWDIFTESVLQAKLFQTHVLAREFAGEYSSNLSSPWSEWQASRTNQGHSITALCHTWVLAYDVLGEPRAANLVAPWLVAYPVALIVCFCSLPYLSRVDPLHCAFR